MNKQEIQEGLYLEEYEKEISGSKKRFRRLISIDGYCFCDKSEKIWDEKEEKEVEPAPEERTYYTKTMLAKGYLEYSNDELNQIFVSVKKEDYMNIA